MIKYLVVVMLTFMDGSVAQYNNGKWDVADSYKECQQKLGAAVAEMKEAFKDQKDPKPSTFIQACVSTEAKE